MFELYENNLVKANHDINKGGLIITIAEMCFKNCLGAELNFKGCYNEELSDDTFLFSESVGRFIIEIDPTYSDKVIEIAKKFKVEVNNIGVLNSESTISVKGLKENDFILEVKKMKEHIYSKRKPLDEVKTLLTNSGFQIAAVQQDSFSLNFIDGTTMFNHYIIKYWFLSEWKKILNDSDLKMVFEQTEDRLNKIAKEKKGLPLTIPFVTIDCIKNKNL